MREPADEVLDVQGPAAPPRRNGELVFQAPWESRLFGVTMALHRARVFAWEEFRQLLIAEVRAWEDDRRPGRNWSYYERWQAALETLLARKGICLADEVGERVASLADRPAGHDH
jgi:nitrile hydratase accessory protein